MCNSTGNSGKNPNNTANSNGNNQNGQLTEEERGKIQDLMDQYITLLAQNSARFATRTPRNKKLSDDFDTVSNRINLFYNKDMKDLKTKDIEIIETHIRELSAINLKYDNFVENPKPKITNRGENSEFNNLQKEFQ